MLPNRLAAAILAVVVPTVMATARHPIDLGFIHGPVPVALGAAATCAAVVAVARPSAMRPAAWTAGLGVTYLVLRAATLLVDGFEARSVSWTGIATNLGFGLYIGLFYYRSIFRAGFLARVDQYHARLRLNGG